LEEDKFKKLTGIFRQNSNELWNDIKYYVFDSPKLNIPFEKRMEKLNQIKFGKYISLISMKQCSGLQDMYEYYENIIKGGGEGIILKQSNSYYESGRTKTSLKVKQFQDIEVRVIEVNRKTFGLLCEQKDGLKCHVKCSAQTFVHPPKPGCVITVKYQGVWKSGKLKYPHFLKERKELSWNDVLNSL